MADKLREAGAKQLMETEDKLGLELDEIKQKFSKFYDRHSKLLETATNYAKSCLTDLKAEEDSQKIKELNYETGTGTSFLICCVATNKKILEIKREIDNFIDNGLFSKEVIDRLKDDTN